jgi:tetratricopeptide (TPR) repeat protein
MALGILNRPEEAIKAYDQAIKINPQDSHTWHLKGAALANLNKPEEAIKALDKAIETKPSD